MSLVIAALLLLAAALQPCHVPGVEEEVRCGHYTVYENRAAREGRKIELNIVVLPAKGPNVAPDPLVFLAGGGVVPATRYAAFLTEAFAKLRAQRDILLIDQRGTGGSNALDCDLSTDPANPEYRDETRFLNAVRRCRQALEQKADLRYYTTPNAMDDLDEVRAWLGYPRLNLYGVSYGSSAAMVYVRQHPERVRTITLQGVVPLDVPMWLEVPRSMQQVLERVLPELPPLPKEIDAEVFRDFVLKSLYSVSRTRELAELVALAHQGNTEPLLSRMAVKVDSGIPRGVYLSIVCNELIPHFDPRDVPAAVAGTFLGSFRLGREISACREWPRGPLPRNFWTPVKSKLPALVMNGELDHLTPPRYGEHVAKSLPRARHIVLPQRGHNDMDECISGMIETFVIAGDAPKVNASCLGK